MDNPLVSCEKRQEANTIRLRRGRAGNRSEGRLEVIGRHGTLCFSGFHNAGTLGNERDDDAAVGGNELPAVRRPFVLEYKVVFPWPSIRLLPVAPRRVAVVRGKDDQHVLIEALDLKFVKNSAD